MIKQAEKIINFLKDDNDFIDNMIELPYSIIANLYIFIYLFYYMYLYINFLLFLLSTKNYLIRNVAI